MIYSQLLNQISNIQHGFGTKDSILPTDPAPWRCKQVHSDQIIDLTTYEVLPATETIEADAVMTNIKNQPIAIRTADCVPILMSAADIGYIAAVHAGWRGTVAGIAAKVVTKMQEEKGADPKLMRVAIGPCISMRHYEVGEDVGKHFDQLFKASKGNGKFLLDLIAANKSALLEAGLLAENIDLIELCTYEREELFHSYRRDGKKAGRNISWVELRSATDS